MTFLCVLISVGEEKDDFNTPTVVFKNIYANRRLKIQRKTVTFKF